MGKLVALAAFVSACGGSQHPTPTGDDATVKSYKPLEIKTDAKTPSRAVILGTDDNNGSTVISLPTAGSTANVDAMYVKLGANASGGFTPVKLATAPNRDGSVQVGIFEEMSGGTGPQWRAGVWVSAFVAATTLGKDLTDFTFSASSSGFIDGASASGLMAGGFLASMTGVPIDPAVTMTGTIGPGGGIPEKFLGSIEKGKKRLGFPIGMRFAKSEATGKMIDLVQLAKDHDAEAIEIANVHEAYKLLTHKQLPEPVPVAEAEMALDDVTIKALDATYKDWQKRLAEHWPALLQLGQAGHLPDALTAIAKMAQDKAAQAEKLHGKGLAGAAVMAMVAASFYAQTATDAYTALEAMRSGATNPLYKIHSLADASEQTAEVVRTIGAIRPATLGAHLQMMSAFQAGLRAWGFEMFATEATKQLAVSIESLVERSDRGSAEFADLVVAGVLPTIMLVDKAVAETALARQELEFETDRSINYLCSIPNVKRMSTSFASASAAGLTYFDTLLIQPLAQQAGMSEDAARQRVAMAEPDYLVAYMTSHLAQAEGMPAAVKAKWGDGSVAWGLMSLAGSELAYFDAAELITKYYSLGIQTDANGRPNQIEHDKAFGNMLASAERTARASARAARIATGSIPVQAKLAYQLAVVARDGDLGDKVDALGSFWQASAYAQTAVALARN